MGRRPTPGRWSLHSWTQDGRFETALELSWRRGNDHRGSRSWMLDAIPELSREKLAGKASVVHFEVRRDAGTGSRSRATRSPISRS